MINDCQGRGKVSNGHESMKGWSDMNGCMELLFWKKLQLLVREEGRGRAGYLVRSGNGGVAYSAGTVRMPVLA